ncbi:MAG: L-rhamnose isomerase [Candidatus Humimicrobiaceae bacterium]
MSLSKTQLYEDAKERYASFGVDTDKTLKILKNTSLSIHCWQGDDCGGFDKKDPSLSGGGILSTGNYPGKARSLIELRNDIEKAFSLIPGKKRLGIHAMYGDFPSKNIDRNQIEKEHFISWIEWAKDLNISLDFHPTLFSHPLANDGFTLSSRNKEVRKFWIEHVNKSREISNYIGESLKSPCVMNLWIPDGIKDNTVSRLYHRQILAESLDEIFSIKFPEENLIDTVESKLFGIGSESYVVGSYDFYLSYALKNNLFLTLDTGHFHPTELVSDKISSLIPFIKGIMLHLSRGVRWDSDHVTIMNDELIAIMQEIVRADAFNKIFISSDFFDGSINRIGAWVIGERAILKSLLFALLEPVDILRKYELENKLFARLGFMEDLKSMPFGFVWDYFCESLGVPKELEWIDEVLKFEKEVSLRK